MIAYLEIIVSDEAVNTQKRHRASLSYLTDAGLGFFPIGEVVVFDFLLKTAKSQMPSRGVGIFKGLLFVQHMFEFADLLAVTGSRRVRSVVTACTKECATPSPRSPLPVKVIEDLEWLLVDGGAERMGPRELSLQRTESPLLLFTDGGLCGEVASLRGVLVHSAVNSLAALVWGWGS
eukprot:4080654-Amphidinium_carterae.1